MAKTQKTTRSSPRPRNRPDDSYDPPGQSIEDFPDDQRIGVTRLPDGRHVVLPESLTRLAGNDLEIAADLQNVTGVPFTTRTFYRWVDSLEKVS